jgi:hypothetical protein
VTSSRKQHIKVTGAPYREEKILCKEEGSRKGLKEED